MRRKYLLGLMLAVVFLIMGFWVVAPGLFGRVTPRPYTGKEGEKISVVVSFYPLYFMASEIGGDRMEVKNLTPAGVEPHDYEPTARDMVILQRAKLLILNGGNFEAWGGKMKEELKSSGVTVLSAGDGLFENNDPHIWLSPPIAKLMATKISVALITLDKENQDYYEANVDKLIEKLSDLDRRYSLELGKCNKKDFVTSHTAFGNMAKTYGLNQIAIAGISPDDEPSTKQLAEIARFAREKEIKYIFFERLVNPKLAETIAEEVGAKTLVLDPIEGISDNDMKQGKNYLTLMEENLYNLRIALQCQ